MLDFSKYQDQMRLTRYQRTVLHQLMTTEHYTPFCFNPQCPDNMPRTVFNGEQFECPCCKWTSSYPKEFIEEYKLEWGIFKTKADAPAQVQL